MHCWWGCKVAQLLWKTVWRLLKKLNTELPCDAAIPLLGRWVSNRYLHTDVHSSTIRNSQKVEATQVSTDG